MRDLSRRLAGVLGARPGDVTVLAWLIALFAVTQAGHGLGSNTGDALFFVRFGVEYLPVMILLSGIAVMVVTVAYAAVLARIGAARLLPAVAWGLAALITVERVAVATDITVVYAVIWLTEQVIVLVTFTMMWGAAGEACDTRQAKRLFPLVASAGIAGGFIGNLATGPLAAALGTPNLLLVHTVLLVGAGVLLAQIARRFFGPHTPSGQSALADLRVGLRATVRSPLFQLIAAAAFVFSLVFFLVVVPFAEIVTASYGAEADVAAFLGYFSATATAASFVVSLFVANRLLARIGVVGVVLIVPVVYALGFSLWLVSFTLVTAALVRGAQWIAVNALGATAWQALFNVERPPLRGHIMAFVTAVPTQLGVVAAGGVLVLGVADLPVRLLALVGLVVALATAEVVRRMRPRYVAALLGALRDGLGDVFTATGPAPHTVVVGADARRTLRDALHSDDVQTRRTAVRVTALLDDDVVIDLLPAMAADPDGSVRAAVIDRLATVTDPRADAVVAAATTDPAAGVRRAAVLAVGRRDPRAPAVREGLRDPAPSVRAHSAVLTRDAEGCAVLATLLASPDDRDVAVALHATQAWHDVPLRSQLEKLICHRRPAIRLAAAAALAAREEGPGDDRLVELLDDPDGSVRLGVADLLRDSDVDTDTLVSCLENGSVRSQVAAVRALRGRPSGRDAVATWAVARAERARSLRGYQAELAAEAAPAVPSRRYLDRVLVQREWQTVRGVLEAVESLAGDQAVHLLSRAARADDPQVRAQAVEAIDSMADRPLARSLLPLLESEPVADRPASTVTAWSVLDDPDPWLRALAVRAAADQIDLLRRRLAEQARRDSAPQVAEALRSLQEAPMTTPHQPAGLIDRILALQAVPMFSDLVPEDLEQIAERCEQRRYAPGEAVYRQGDPGDEMFIVTSGEVRIVRRGDSTDGTTREVRRYGPGDHVGELSLLRGQPRVADVVAGDDGVIGLALDAPSFRAILDDRPEVVLAMLATLAERLSIM